MDHGEIILAGIVGENAPDLEVAVMKYTNGFGTMVDERGLDFELLVYHDHGKELRLWDHLGNNLLIPNKQNFFAIGIGAPVAMGASAPEAVAIACKYTPECGDMIAVAQFSRVDRSSS